MARSLLGIVCAVLALEAPAQSRPARELKLLVLRDGGKPLDRAKVTFFPAPRYGLPFPGVVELRLPPVEARTDLTGHASIPCETPRGALLVEHAERQLGALVTEISSTVLRVETRPLGRIAGDDPSVALALDVAAVLPRGGLAILGRRGGGSIDLPPGKYRLLGEDRGRLVELGAEVRSGATLTLPRPLDELTVDLRAAPQTRLVLPGWECLLPSSGGRVRVPAAPEVRKVVLVSESEGALVREELLLDASSARPFVAAGIATATRSLAIVDAAGRAVEGALVLSVRLVGPSARLWSRATSDRAGRVCVPVPGPNEQAEVIVVSAGQALATAKLSATEPVRLQLREPRELRVRAVDTSGAPLPGLVLGLATAAAPWLVREAVTDGAGVASFALCGTEPATLSVADTTYARSELPLRADQVGSEAAVRLEVAPGLVLSGQVVGPDGAPASHVLVTLRDPDRPSEVGLRVEECDELGRFRFAGLPEGRPFTLRASREVRGETLSAELPGARPGDAPWQLVLKSEDVPSPQKR